MCRNSDIVNISVCVEGGHVDVIQLNYVILSKEGGGRFIFRQRFEEGKKEGVWRNY